MLQMKKDQNLPKFLLQCLALLTCLRLDSLGDSGLCVDSPGGSCLCVEVLLSLPNSPVTLRKYCDFSTFVKHVRRLWTDLRLFLKCAPNFDAILFFSMRREAPHSQINPSYFWFCNRVSTGD